MDFSIACFCSSLRLASVTGITFSKSKSVFDMLILILNLGLIRCAKRCVGAKVDLQTQRANTRFNVKACQLILPYNRQRW